MNQNLKSSAVILNVFRFLPRPALGPWHWGWRNVKLLVEEVGFFSFIQNNSNFSFTGDSTKYHNLSKSTRRSSTGSSRSSLSPDEEKPKPMSRQFSLNEPNQRLNKDILAKIGNRQTKVVAHTSEKVKKIEKQNISKISEKCAECLKPLADDGFFALGQLFHKSCFR